LRERGKSEGRKEGRKKREGKEEEELLTIMSYILKCLLIVNYQQVQNIDA
jgi:predicted transposase YdaD